MSVLYLVVKLPLFVLFCRFALTTATAAGNIVYMLNLPYTLVYKAWKFLLNTHNIADRNWRLSRYVEDFSGTTIAKVIQVA